MSTFGSATVRIPGKVMLSGEYAVLRGAAAVAATVDGYMQIEVKADQAGETDSFKIVSDQWSEPVFVQSGKSVTKGEDPLSNTVRTCMEKYGFDSGSVHVTSELNPSFGIGSSSAIRLGVMLAFEALNHSDELISSPRGWDILREGFLLQKKAQGNASGYDLATQFVGGLVVMHPSFSDESWPGSITRLTSLNDHLTQLVHPFIGGNGAPTGKLMKEVLQWLDVGERWDTYMGISKVLSDAFMDYLVAPDEKDNARELFAAVAKQRLFLKDSPAVAPAVFAALSSIEGLDKTWSYKTTGAGGEDAILLIGTESDLNEATSALSRLGWDKLPFDFCTQPTTIARGELQ